MKTIAIKLPDELLAKIERVAQQRSKTRSAVMREVLEDFLADQRRLARRPCLDLARDLAGCVRGPEDLSINPANMDDYGK